MITYRPEIDGLRAIAVIPVVLFHLGFDWIAGGYLGVDVFFVISGYLITQIVFTELQAGTFSYANFISRRVRRIGPVLVAVVLATLLVTVAGGMEYDFAFVAEQSMSALFFSANVYFWNYIGNYWGPTAEESVLLHTWSLSLEEQFYLVFPWLVVLLWRLGRNALVRSMWVMMLGSMVAFLYTTFDHPQAAFYLLPTRAWELLSGSLLALYSSGHRVANDSAAGQVAATDAGFRSKLELRFPILGVGLIALAYFFDFGQSTLTANRFAAVIGCLLLLAFPGTGAIYNLLASRVCVWIGKLSYSIYMWHWPLIVWSNGATWLENRFVLGLAIVLVSGVSYYCIEHPTRRRIGVVPWILASYGVTCALAMGVYWYAITPDATTSGMQTPVWHGARFNLTPHGESPAWASQLRSANVVTPPFEKQVDAYVEGGLIIGPSTRPEIVVLGDSHAAMWSNTLLECATTTKRTISLWSIHGVDPFVRLPVREQATTGDLTASEKFQYDNARLEFIERWQPDVVILAVRWALWGTENANDLLRFLENHAGRVLIVGPVPESDLGDRIVVQHLRLSGWEPHATKPLYMKMKNATEMNCIQAELDALVSRYANVSLIPVADLYARGENVLVVQGTQAVYLDDDHLAEFGAQLAKRRLAEAIEATLRELSE